MSFRVEQIDHVEVFVPDQQVAATWYAEVLGLTPVPAYAHWATGGGPLMISSDGGRTMLALFEGEPRGQRPTAGHHRVAFRVAGSHFLGFLEHIATAPVYQDDGTSTRTLRPVDHDCAWSVYFCDPYGNRYEITTYDYDEVAGRL